MKLFELNFTLLREFEELEDLFDLLNQMVIVKGNHLTVSVKSENDVKFLKIYLYRCLKTPSIGIMRDLESLPSKETLDSLNKINFEEVFLKFNIKDSKYITIEVYDSVYEYIPRSKKLSTISMVNNEDVEELFTLEFSFRKPFSELPDLIYVINTMLSNNCCSFITLENRYIEFGSGSAKKNLHLNFFTNSVSRPSLFFNVNLQGKFNARNISKYNMLCSQAENSIHVYLEIHQIDDQHGPTMIAHIYLDKSSANYDRIKEQCKLIDFITTP